MYQGEHIDYINTISIKGDINEDAFLLSNPHN